MTSTITIVWHYCMLMGSRRCTLKKGGTYQRNQEIRVRQSGETEVTAEVTDLSSIWATSFDSIDLREFVKQPASIVSQSYGEADSDNDLRPWLYGNWWMLKPPVPVHDRPAPVDKVLVPYSLIGAGVRLTKWLESHD